MVRQEIRSFFPAFATLHIEKKLAIMTKIFYQFNTFFVDDFC